MVSGSFLIIVIDIQHSSAFYDLQIIYWTMNCIGTFAKKLKGRGRKTEEGSGNDSIADFRLRIVNLQERLCKDIAKLLRRG